MKVFQFINKQNNGISKWPRFFVAISMSRAIEVALEWEDMWNECHKDYPDYTFTFDVRSVIMVEDTDFYDKEGYLDARWLQST